MKKKLGLIALAICISSASYSDDSFAWHGYMRASNGFDSDLANLSADDEAIHSLGRYGLEYNDFISTTFSKRWNGDNGTWAQYNFGITVVDSLTPSLSNGSNYVSMVGFDFLPKDSSIWVGKRKIDGGVDVLDYLYRNFNGRGFGYTSKNLDLNFFKEYHFPTTSEYDDGVTVDAVYRLGNATVEATATKITANTTTTDKSDKDETSLSILASYKQNKFMALMPGSTTYRLQFGKGVTADKLNYSNVTDKDDTGYRFTIDGSHTGTNWNINSIVLAEGSHVDSLDKETSTVTLLVRGTNKVTSNLSMIYEASVVSKENNKLNDDASIFTETADGIAYKITVGPTLQLSTVPYTKPVIRFTAAVVGGDKEVTGLDKDNELRFGAQFETAF